MQTIAIAQIGLNLKYGQIIGEGHFYKGKWVEPRCLAFTERRLGDLRAHVERAAFVASTINNIAINPNDPGARGLFDSEFGTERQKHQFRRKIYYICSKFIESCPKLPPLTPRGNSALPS